MEKERKYFYISDAKQELGVTTLNHFVKWFMNLDDEELYEIIGGLLTIEKSILDKEEQKTDKLAPCPCFTFQDGYMFLDNEAGLVIFGIPEDDYKYSLAFAANEYMASKLERGFFALTKNIERGYNALYNCCYAAGLLDARNFTWEEVLG